MKKDGFTLAEVLITLGIIGVVAALTIPNLIQSYKKKYVEVRLARFYSTMSQALKLNIAENGTITFEQKDLTDSEYLTQWYKDNVTKYIKTIIEEGPEVNNTYYKVAFTDGSGFNSYYSGTKPDGSAGLGNLYLFYCVNYTNCKLGSFDGTNTFLFIINPNTAQILTYGAGDKTENLLRDCGTPNRQWGCVTLIMRNNWKIPDNYPLKF